MTARCPLKAEAAAQGATRYTSSTPCSKGHGFERLVASGSCVECAKEKRRASYWKDSSQRDAERERARVRRTVDPQGERLRDTLAKLKAEYGLTEQQYWYMWVSQSGRCAICPNEIVSRLDVSRPIGVSGVTAHVDHCHSTNAIRGLLCSNCNTGLGKFRDDAQLLLNAAGYLRASAPQQAQPVAGRESVSEIEPGNRDLDSNVRRGNRRDELSPFF